MRSTDAESLLWQRLRAKQFIGVKFRRQQRIGNYIVDFVSFQKKLIIELDGGQHTRKIDKDRQRDDWLKSQGFTILRFWNRDVVGNTEDIFNAISKHLR